MGLFKRTPKTPPVDPAEVAELREQLTQLRAELASINAVNSEQSRRASPLSDCLPPRLGRSCRIDQQKTLTHSATELRQSLCDEVLGLVNFALIRTKIAVTQSRVCFVEQYLSFFEQCGWVCRC